MHAGPWTKELSAYLIDVMLLPPSLLGRTAANVGFDASTLDEDADVPDDGVFSTYCIPGDAESAN